MVTHTIFALTLAMSIMADTFAFHTPLRFARTSASRISVSAGYRRDLLHREVQFGFPIRQTRRQGYPLYSNAASNVPQSLQSSEQTALLKSILELTRKESDGTKLPPDQRETINSLVESLEKMTSQDESLDMTSTPLEEEHRLIYIDSKQTPQYIGPFKGMTTQYFINEQEFQNRLSVGPIQVALTSLTEHMDAYRMKVKFKSFVFKVFGNEVVKKELKQQGVWKMVFVGEVVDDSENGNRKKILLRIMRTPSLYILVKEL